MNEGNPFSHYKEYSDEDVSEKTTQPRNRQPLQYSQPRQPQYMFQRQPDNQNNHDEVLKTINKVGTLLFHLTKDFKKFRDEEFPQGLEALKKENSELRKEIDKCNQNSQKNYDVQSVIAVSVLGEGIKNRGVEITDQYEKIKESIEQIKNIVATPKKKDSKKGIK